MDFTEGPLKPGLLLGRYELLTPVAKGGMAEVWAARLSGTRGFQKTVAIKTMLPNLSDDPRFEQMFLDEAALASRIRHPNAVEILDLGETRGILYLVMEWIDGEPLSVVMKQAMKENGMPIPLIVRIIMQSCAGLHAAHELKDDSGGLVGLVHRDVSPQNILVTYEGVVKVVDFGVAKATGRVSGETAAGQIKGKVPYMSPEQAIGGDVDRRTDIFATGILLYMMTTGRHPFRKENDAQTLMNICSDTPIVPPSALVEDYPPELEDIVMRALCRNPDERFQTANEMQRALNALPSELRASTDDEIGDFMKALLSERMLKRRAFIQKALQSASQRDVSRISVNDEVSAGQLTPLSGVSQLSQFGPPSRHSSTSVGVAVVNGPPSDATPDVAPPVAAEPGKPRALGVVGGVLFAALAAAGVYFLVIHPRGSESHVASAPPPPVQQAPSAAPVAEPTTVEKPAVAAVQPSALPSAGAEDIEFEAAGSATKTGAAKRHVAGRAPVPVKPGAKPTAASAPAEAKPEPPKPAEPKPGGAKPFVSPFRDPDF